MDYQILNVADLIPFNRRDMRDAVVTKLTKRIEAGYNPARPLTVVKDNGSYLVADGNHRLDAVNTCGLTKVPCVIREGNPYAIAMECNSDEDSYAPEDLFDKLDTIKALKDTRMSQVEIGRVIGMEESMMSRYVKLYESILPKVLDLAKSHQEGRVNHDLPNVNFTEGWFRDSGLYDLNEDNQLEFMEWFVTAKKSETKGIKPKDKAKKLLLKQEAEQYVEENLLEGADGLDILGNIEKGLYKNLEQVEKAVAKVNEQFLDKQRIQIKNMDAFDMLAELPDNSVDCICTDPPYNVTSNDWDKFENNDDYLSFLEKVISESKRVLKSEYHFYIFMDLEHIAKVELLLNKIGFDIQSRIAWVRKNMSKGRVVANRFISQWEMVFHCGTKPLNFPDNWGDERGDVQEFAVPQSNFNDKKEHPTQKPLELIKRFIELGTEIGDMVVDPFCGSGTTAKACDELNRKCVTSDTNQQYVEGATLRIFGSK